MARIAGIDLKNKLLAEYSLAEIVGIGLTSAKKILKDAGVKPMTRMSDVDESQIAKIKDLVESNYKVEGELRAEVQRNIKRLKDIRSYIGQRHKMNLPVHGQKTRTNARTRKGKKSMAVGGLKRVLSKT